MDALPAVKGLVFLKTLSFPRQKNIKEVTYFNRFEKFNFNNIYI